MALSCWPRGPSAGQYLVSDIGDVVDRPELWAIYELTAPGYDHAALSKLPTPTKSTPTHSDKMESELGNSEAIIRGSDTARGSQGSTVVPGPRLGAWVR